MRWLRILILIFAVSVVDTALLCHVSVAGMRPDLALILAVFVSLHTTALSSVPACWLMGLVKDIYSVGPIGLNAFILSVCGGYISQTKDYVYKDHPLVQLFLTASAALLGNLIYLGMMFLSQGSSFGNPQAVAFRLLCGVTYTALPAPFLLLLLRGLKPWMGFANRTAFDPKEEH